MFIRVIAIVLWIWAVLFVTAAYTQMQQSGGPAGADVGLKNATSVGSVGLSGVEFNTTLPTLASGQMGAAQSDSNARPIIVGAGTAGSPAGGVASIQGVASGTAVPVSGTVTSNQGGTWTVQPGNTANTTAWLVTGTGGTFPATQSGAWTVQPGNTQNTTAWLAETRPSTSCAETVFDSGITVIPTVSTAATATATCVVAMYFNNTTASAATVTVTDNQPTPVAYVSSFSIPANSNLLLTFAGIKFASGIKWLQGTGSAINGQILGHQ